MPKAAIFDIDGTLIDLSTYTRGRGRRRWSSSATM